MVGRLQGRRIAITGAAQGIGLAIAEACAAEGARLCLIDRDESGLSRLQDLGDLSLADISDPESVAAAFASFGPVDGLVNNAGVNVFAATPLAATDEAWRRNLAVNLEGAWSCIRAVLPAMLAAGRGAVVNIASTHSMTVIPGTFPYPVAKHALLGLTRSLALELAPQGIRVNAIAPGYVATQKVLDWWNEAPDPAAARSATLALHPQGRIAEPAEIAAAAIFLLSEECPFLIGHCLTIDGGLSIRQHG